MERLRLILIRNIHLIYVTRPGLSYDIKLGISHIKPSLIHYYKGPPNAGFQLRKGGHYLTAAVLLDHGASPEQQDQYGNKALHLAVQGSHLAVAQLLLQRGASIQAFNNERQNALHFASQTGNRRIVQLLLDSGIDNSARDRLGRSPLYIAASHGNSRWSYASPFHLFATRVRGYALVPQFNACP
ncbi:uncharacterized protein LAJ45_10572 [Morchella importuna]|uniref:uncharacterized protein n=1 Tax=Morchella importuna TaxID=1174673 RepID=UPI001E8CF64F|nr:uncharacterized protein LAJ45_10572 [Morchella importuna]KAH8145450.1 hypothetical protein LAJ45_10572 [Morchella importuna]